MVNENDVYIYENCSQSPHRGRRGLYCQCLIVTSLNLSRKIPTSYNWQGPTFYNSRNHWFFNGILWFKKGETMDFSYVTFNLRSMDNHSLIGDVKQKFSPLVVGEGVGLIVVLLALLAI